ncbi:hypothetical protein BDN72DRAFT_730557, partial [Pluteus cervinus]
AKVNNTPRIGCKTNVAFPALQINIAPAVEEATCRSQGLEDLGEFGSVNGHRDDNDSPGALTTMIVNSDVPIAYERGRFHILALGIYVELDQDLFISFPGRFMHGGSPPIAPAHEPVRNDAYRLVAVLYPPEVAIMSAGSKVIPLGSLPNGKLLNLGPEITNPLNSSDKFELATDANWIADGHVLLEPEEHLRFAVESMFKLCNYLFHQLPPRYHPTIDPKKFYSAFSI